MENAPAKRDSNSQDVVQSAIARTPARVLIGRTGPGYRTVTWLKLREDHAAARDAVHNEVYLTESFSADDIEQFGLFAVQTRAQSKAEYLMRPDLGRLLDDEAQRIVRERCVTGADLQIVIGDGLSAAAVNRQARPLLRQLSDSAKRLGWTLGTPFLVRYCRVGLINEIGALLDPLVVALLIGERPGLATAESLSAYLAYRPRPGQTDADRNLISNIHSRGINTEEASQRILALVSQMRLKGQSGVAIKEEARQASLHEESSGPNNSPKRHRE